MTKLAVAWCYSGSSGMLEGVVGLRAYGQSVTRVITCPVRLYTLLLHVPISVVTFISLDTEIVCSICYLLPLIVVANIHH